MSDLTKQQRDPHPELVQCRNAVQEVLEVPDSVNPRKVAASVCDLLEDDEVDAVIAAGGDKAKIKAAIKRVSEGRDEVMDPRDIVDDKKPKAKSSAKK